MTGSPPPADTNPTSHQIETGLVRGAVSFQLLAEIATGPTARVELCRLVGDGDFAGKLCAVKRLHPHIAEDPQFSTMFADEVWMTASLRHPNVVGVVSWGNDSLGTFLAFELVEGVSLARLMKTVFETREAFTERMVVFIGAEICAGLSAAHALRGIDGEHLRLVHRDLTPGNVLCGFDGAVKVADFGLAKAKQRVTKTLTGLLKGNPHYMAPEQAREGELDGRADLFSLGVLLFELFTGVHPWSGATTLEVFRVMATEPALDLMTLRPKIDRELAAIVNRLLERDPSRRFQSADEVRDRLDLWLYSHGYKEDSADSLARFVRRNAMRQMRWFERAVAGEFTPGTEGGRRRQAAPGEVSRRPGEKPPLLEPGAAKAVLSTTAAPTKTGSTSPSARRRWRRDREGERENGSEDNTSRTPASGRQEDGGGDWGEEQVPTIVKPHMGVRELTGPSQSYGHLAQSMDTTPGGLGRPEDNLPSFEDPFETDGEHNPTTVKAGPSMRGEMRAPSAPRVPEPGDTFREMQVDGGASRGQRESHPRSEAPPPPGRGDPRDIDDDGSTHARPVPEAVRNLPPQARGGIGLVTRELAAVSHGAMQRVTTFSGDADVRAESERLQREALRMAEEAERALKMANHRALLARYAADAATLGTDAQRASAGAGLAHALPLLTEAHRLEDTWREAARSGKDPPPRGDGPSNAPPPLGREASRRGGGPTSAGRPSSELSALMRSDVGGVPVPAAIGVTFLLAVAVVVLIALLAR